jgi:hypothetical protein
MHLTRPDGWPTEECRNDTPLSSSAARRSSPLKTRPPFTRLRCAELNASRAAALQAYLRNTFPGDQPTNAVRW